MINCPTCQTPYTIDRSQCPTCGSAATSGDNESKPSAETFRAASANLPSSAASPVPRSGKTALTPTVAAAGAGGSSATASSPLDPGTRRAMSPMRVTGTVSGAAVTGFRPYRATSLLVSVLILAALTVANARSSNQLLVSLLWPILLLGVIAVVGYLAARQSAMRSGRAPTYGVNVTTFRLVSAEGEMYDCRLLGDAIEGSVRTGDALDVRGRFRIDHALQASRITNVKTGAVVQSRTSSIYRALVLGRMAVIVFAIIGVMGTFTAALV